MSSAQDMIAAAREVIAAWESGNLADAVNNLECVVNEYRVPTEEDEDRYAAWLTEQIEDGALDLESMGQRLARYGLADPSSWMDEFDERMELAADEAEEDDDAAPGMSPG